MRLTAPRVVVLAAVAAVAAALPAPAAAAPRVVSADLLTVSAADAKRQSCATRPVSGAGVTTRTVTAPADGVIDVRMSGAQSGDWDLALVDASRKVLDGSAGPGTQERSNTFVREGQAITIQACRRTGAGEAANLAVRFIATDKATTESGYKVKLVRVALATQFDRIRLQGLDLDTTDHAAPDHQDVLLWSAADERKLTGAGFSFGVEIADVQAKDNANRRFEQRAKRSATYRSRAARALPSGRTTYRTLTEINDELKTLAEQNPTFVKLFALPVKSVEGRDIVGIEIAENVGSPSDGRPSFVNIGTHHAREWPANEATIEWGYELVNGYKAGDARVQAIVRGGRNFVIPVMNVDGFDVTIKSEGLAPGGSYSNPLDSGGVSGNQGVGTGAYKRKNCRKDARDPNAAPEIPCLARSYPPSATTNDRGVDLNRNYGILWGGPGTSSDFQSLTFHGTGPFSEPETDAVRQFVRSIHPAVLITNHTYTGLLLRPPGTADQAPVPDEAQLKALGDRMAYETDYISQFAYQLYDTTGTTDDYLYGGLNAFSYTPEIGKEEFHPDYIDGPDPGTGDFIKEYEGNVVDGEQRGGLREAFKVAAETAIDPASHSVLRGTAPAGRVLRLSRTVTYRTDSRPDDDDPDDGLPAAADKNKTITEPRQTVLTVPASGAFEWHINPSTQPNQDETPWKLTCEDAAGNVLESRDVFIARKQSVTLGLACDIAALATAPAAPAATCTLPDGFRSVNVRRRGNGLRITFSRKIRNPVRIEVFQTAKGRRIVLDKRVARFNNRSRGFTWSGRATTGRKRAVANGVYVVRFRMTDANRRIDSRRIVVERKRGRFSKRGGFDLVNPCK